MDLTWRLIINLNKCSELTFYSVAASTSFFYLFECDKSGNYMNGPTWYPNVLYSSYYFILWLLRLALAFQESVERFDASPYEGKELKHLQIRAYILHALQRSTATLGSQSSCSSSKFHPKNERERDKKEKKEIQSFSYMYIIQTLDSFYYWNNLSYGVN